MQLLSHEETLRLIKLAQKGDECAKETLFIRNEALVKSIVRGFLGRAEYDDLVQIGNVGLMKAIIGYDESFGVRFSTYAVPMIAGDIKRFLRDDGIIKVSRSVKEKGVRIFKAQEEIKRKLKRDPTIEEIAKALDMERAEIVFAMEAVNTPCSLYEPAVHGDESKTVVIDTIEEKQTRDITDKILLKELLTKLSPYERKLIVLRFFMDKTQTQIAKIMGISQVQVSRHISKILKKLHDAAV